MGLAGLLLACALWCAAAAGSAQASGPLSGQPAVASVEATAQRAITPVVNRVKPTVAAVRRTAERSAAEAPVSAPVTQAPATVVRSLSPPASTSSPEPAHQRKTARERRGSGVVARAAIADPAPSGKRVAVRRTTAAAVHVAVTGTAVPQRSVSPRPQAPQHSVRGAGVAPADDLAPAPAAPSSAAAATSAGSAAGATALLALFALIAFAAPRLGGLIRLPAGSAPMPPVLALPERPG